MALPLYVAAEKAKRESRKRREMEEEENADAIAYQTEACEKRGGLVRVL